jgi:hypothetical protein
MAKEHGFIVYQALLTIGQHLGDENCDEPKERAEGARTTLGRKVQTPGTLSTPPRMLVWSRHLGG